MGMKVMELKKGWRKEATKVLLDSGWLILTPVVVLNTAQEYYTIQHSADPVNREKGNITHIGLLEADEDKILVAQVSPKGSTCA